jgi:hypothetical protein
MATPDWAPLARNYEDELVKFALPSTSVVAHPLLPRQTHSIQQRTGTTQGTQGAQGTSTTFSIKSKSLNSNSTKMRGDPLNPLASSSDPLSDPLSNPLSNPPPSFVDPLAQSFIDPLGMNGGGVGGSGGGRSDSSDDPLSLSSSTGRKTGNAARREDIEMARQSARDVQSAQLSLPWAARKLQILKDYRVDGNVTLNSSKFETFAGSGVEVRSMCLCA